MIAYMQTQEWNITLRKIMPDDLRITNHYSREFYRALTYLVIKRIIEGSQFYDSW